MRVSLQWRRAGITKLILILVFLLISCQYLANVIISKRSVIALDYLQRSLGALANQTTLFTTAKPNNTIPQLKRCPYISPNLQGRFYAKTDVPSWITLQEKFAMLEPGGRYRPSDCIARNKVAIIIPYRDREIHLKIFLNNLHTFLQRQQHDYGVFVVEMAEGIPFNRALLMNVGFLEASMLYDYECFIFHDVDLIPEDDRNLYSCPASPRHMSVAIDKMNYKLPYSQIFGGVSALSKHDFEKVNGFSNLYFGWGAEDDDMYRRIVYSGMTVIRYSPVVARYKMLVHAKDKGNPDRWKLLRTVKSRQQQDGINSLNYTVLTIEEKQLYTWILISVNETEIMNDAEIQKFMQPVNAPKQQQQQQQQQQEQQQQQQPAQSQGSVQQPPQQSEQQRQQGDQQQQQPNQQPRANQQQQQHQQQPNQQTPNEQQQQQNQQQQQPGEQQKNPGGIPNQRLPPKKSVRTKLHNPKVVDWIPAGFNGTLPYNLTVFEPLPIKKPTAAELKRRQALRAKKQKSVSSKNQVVVAQNGPTGNTKQNQQLYNQEQQQQKAIQHQKPPPPPPPQQQQGKTLQQHSLQSQQHHVQNQDYQMNQNQQQQQILPPTQQQQQQLQQQQLQQQQEQYRQQQQREQYQQQQQHQQQEEAMYRQQQIDLQHEQTLKQVQKHLQQTIRESQEEFQKQTIRLHQLQQQQQQQLQQQQQQQLQQQQQQQQQLQS